MAESSTATRSQQPASTGSSFSDKQIYKAAVEEKLVRVMCEGKWFQGYLMGSDTFHWGIVDANGDVHLVHKSVGVLTICATSVVSLDEKPREAVRSVTRGFVDFVNRTVFNKTT